MSTTETVRIHRLKGGIAQTVEDTVAVEQPVSIEIDGDLQVETTCSPGDLGAWVLGYLASEGWITKPQDVARLVHDEGAYSVRLRHRPIRKKPAPVDSEWILGRDRLFDVAAELVARSETFKQTGGTHAMAIADGNKILAFAEDISRTCALEKAIGEALALGCSFAQSLAFLSSRVPSRMITKLARCGVPIVAAVSAPTAEAVALAERYDMALCGFVRGNRLNVYAHGWRLEL